MKTADGALGSLPLRRVKKSAKFDLIYWDAYAGSNVGDDLFRFFAFFLREGGILMGHDYQWSPHAIGKQTGSTQVLAFVFHLAARFDLTLHVGADSTWWVQKPMDLNIDSNGLNTLKEYGIAA